MHNQNHLSYNSGMWMLKQSQCQHILHVPNLCTECTVPTFLQVYWWSTAVPTPNTSHPLRHPFLGCHVFFLMFWVFSFLLFGVVCCRVLTSLVLVWFLLLWHLFLGCQSRLRLYHLVVPLLQPAPAKLVQVTPHTPTWQNMLVSNIPA